MAEITPSDSRKKRKGFSINSRGHKLIRVDLTPMVDLGFLLITFFVFTTTMAESKAMEILETHDGPPKPVKNSTTMTIILAKNHEIYYYNGELGENNSGKQVQKASFKTIRSIIVDKKRRTDSNFLMYLIKADKESTFGDNIDLLDEMAICKVPSGHYAEVDITEKELEIIRDKSSK